MNPQRWEAYNSVGAARADEPGVAPRELPVGDEELLLRYRQSGDRSHFEQLVGRYERELYNYLRRYLGDAELAEDAFQATFLQVHLKGDQFEAGRRFRPWLYSIATNQAIDAQRRNKRHRMTSLNRQGTGREGEDLQSLVDLLISEDADPSERLTRRERAERVQQALEELSDPMRSVVNLVYYQGMKYREAADVLGIPVGTVKSRLHTAMLKLGEFWQDRQYPDD